MSCFKAGLSALHIPESYVPLRDLKTCSPKTKLRPSLVPIQAQVHDMPIVGQEKLRRGFTNDCNGLSCA